MPTLDTEARQVAVGLIEEFGKSVEIRRMMQNTYDPVSGTGGEDSTPVNYPVKVTPPEAYKIKDINGSYITTGEMIISLADQGAPVIPDKDTDDVLLEGEYWNILDIEKVWSGELVAMHTLRIGK